MNRSSLVAWGSAVILAIALIYRILNPGGFVAMEAPVTAPGVVFDTSAATWLTVPISVPDLFNDSVGNTHHVIAAKVWKGFYPEADADHRRPDLADSSIPGDAVSLRHDLANAKWVLDKPVLIANFSGKGAWICVEQTFDGTAIYGKHKCKSIFQWEDPGAASKEVKFFELEP